MRHRDGCSCRFSHSPIARFSGMAKVLRMGRFASSEAGQRASAACWMAARGCGKSIADHQAHTGRATDIFEGLHLGGDFAVATKNLIAEA